MAAVLGVGDYFVIVGYFVFVLFVGLWVGLRTKLLKLQ